jgi:hypothetical protein
MCNASSVLCVCRRLHSELDGRQCEVGEGCAPSDAAFLGRFAMSRAGVTSLSIENGAARTISGSFLMAGVFNYVKNNIHTHAYGVYSTKTTKLEIAAKLRDKDGMFCATPVDMPGRIGGFLQNLFPSWKPPIGKNNDYFVFQDGRMLGTLRAKCQGKYVDLVIERENCEVLGHAKIMRPHNSSHLDFFIRGSSRMKFNVSKESSFLVFIFVILNLLFFLWWWCKPWKKKFPSMDMVLPASLPQRSLGQDDIILLFAFSLLIRADWLKYKSDDDFGG